MKKMNIFPLFFILLVFCGCTSKDSTSSLQIQFQTKGVSAQTLAAEDIEIIIVNVSGPGIPATMVAQRDCHDEGQLCNSIELLGIPTGTSRLIQLLVVTRESDDGTGGSAIYYGDVTKELSGETQVAITLQEKANFNDEADFMGRYIPKSTHALAGKYLTGSLDVSVHIGDGKPDMTIGSTEIFGGWFQLFLLDSVAFKYHFTGWDENGNKIPRTEVFNDFHGGAGFNIAKLKSMFSSGSKRIASFNYNGTYMEQRETSVFVQRNFEEKIFAFLDGLTSTNAAYKEVCYDTTSFTFDNSEGSHRSICKTVSGGTCTDYLAFNNSGNSNTVVVGSLPAASASCSGGIATQKWELDIKNLEDEEEFSGFQGLITNNGSADSRIVEVDGSMFNWQADSKVTLNGFHILKLVTSDFNSDDVRTHGMSDGYDCNKMKNSLGFTVAATISKNASNNYSYDAGAADMSQLRLAICPIAPNGQYYNSVYFYNGYHYSSSDSGPGNITNFFYEIYPEAGPGSGSIFSSVPFEMPPIPGESGTFFYYIKITNSMALDSLSINNINPAHVHYSGYYSIGANANVSARASSLEGTIPSGLMSVPRCSIDATNAVTPSNGGLGPSGVLGAMQPCFFELKVEVTGTVTYPETYYDGITIEFNEGYAHMELITPIAPIYEDMVPSTNLLSSGLSFDAPNGEQAVKTFILRATSSSIQFDSITLESDVGAIASKFTLDGDCFMKIPSMNMGESCTVVVRYDGDGNNTASASYAHIKFGNFDFNSSGSPFDDTIPVHGSSSLQFVANPGIAGGIVNLGNISSPTTINYTITNNSGNPSFNSYFIGSPGDGLIPPVFDITLYDNVASPYTMSACWKSPGGLGNSSTCSFSHIVDPPSATSQNHMFFLYEHGGDFRSYEFGIHFE